MPHKPWREISAKNHEDPERMARVEAGARAMLAISALTQRRESLGLTQAELASSLAMSPARISQIEHQGDVTLSTMDQVVHGMGGELVISVQLPGRTLTPLGSETSAPGEDAA